ncbi:MAG: amidohydrolase [Firmicutes bacterium]|nr:amidohydrolase [Bacillota bacterium]
MLSGIKVIDIHAHFPVSGHRLAASVDYIERFGEERAQILAERKAKVQQRWRKMYGLPEPETEHRTTEELTEKWIAEVERYGLEKVVFLTGAGNDELAKVVQAAPDRFIGFAHHSPFAESAADELERAITKLGFKGYKVVAPRESTALDDPAAYPVWEVANHYKIPVLIHFGPLGGVGGVANHININPLIIHDVAKGFPDIPFIIPHFGCGYPTQLLQLMWSAENVFTDTSGSNEWVRWMMPDMNLEDLFAKFLQVVGPDRILFGTDSSWFPRGFVVSYFEEQLRICRRLNVSDEGVDKIFNANAARLLQL